MSNPPIEVSVVVPCHNELADLRPLVEAIRAALEPLKVEYEMVFTDDRSDDGSWATQNREPSIRRSVLDIDN
jgi:dolichol-phosphate mannosyltransferase